MNNLIIEKTSDGVQVRQFDAPSRSTTGRDEAEALRLYMEDYFNCTFIQPCPIVAQAEPCATNVLAMPMMAAA